MAGLLSWIPQMGKDKKQAQENFQTAVNQMYPNESFTNAAIRMQHGLDAGQLTPDQYRWNKRPDGSRDTLPWRLSPQHWVDLMSTQEGLDTSQVNQLHSDYWKMNYLPDALNNSKNIDILIKASELDKSNTTY